MAEANPSDKWGVIIGHGAVNSALDNFIIPPGFKFMFLVPTGDPSSNVALQQQELVPEFASVYSRNDLRTTLDGAHVYNSGDLLIDHIISFDPAPVEIEAIKARIKGMEESGAPPDHIEIEKKMYLTTGIIGPDKEVPIENYQVQTYTTENEAFRFHKESLRDRDIKLIKLKKLDFFYHIYVKY